MTCPCHSGQSYSECCQPYHKGQEAPTPEALMRARYSAFALHDADFIMRTTHEDSPHRKEDRRLWIAEILAFATQTQFIALNILETTEDTVTFRAGLMQNLRDSSFTEKSSFRCVKGKWLYVTGQYD
ncbi:MAG: zinc chelation protein SecC [Anaerolineaceae bacterium]|nr:zinc chelation protein SecC [Anaerolineaceae bacterium]